MGTSRSPHWPAVGDSRRTEAHPARRRYASFLLRCWRVGGDGRRIEVEQIQTGAHTRVNVIAAALAWIDSCCSDAFGHETTASPTQRRDEEDKGLP